jgi:hypothetical protein
MGFDEPNPPAQKIVTPVLRQGAVPERLAAIETRLCLRGSEP